jgi:protein TonB
MKRVWRALVLFFFAAGLSLAQRPEPLKEPRFEPAEVTFAVEAPYPPNSVAAGTVVFEVTLSASGEIENIRRVREVASLTDVAERALKQWRFRPATLDGKPVRSKTSVAFTFTRPVVAPTRPQ